MAAVSCDAVTKIVAVFVLDTRCGNDRVLAFMGHKRQKTKASCRPGSDKAFIKRACEVLDEALGRVPGGPFSDVLRMSFQAMQHRRVLTIIIEGPPYLHGLTSRRAFEKLLTEQLAPYAEFVQGLRDLYSSGASLPEVSNERDGRRPLKTGWADEKEFCDAFEDVTEEVRVAHSVVRKPNPGPPPIFWTPPCAPERLQPGSLIDGALTLTGLDLALDDVDPSAVEEDEGRAFARLTPAGGFTCPAGLFHPAGCRATIELRAGYVKFTCHGPQRAGVLGFGRECCVDHYGPLPPKLFDLKEDLAVPCIEDSEGVGRAANLILEEVLKLIRDAESTRPYAAGYRVRCGSGKTTAALALFLDFLRKYPKGRLVYASSNRELVKAIYERLAEMFPDIEVLHYDVKVDRERLRSAQIVSVCTSSLSVCIGRSCAAPTMLILDELESTAGMLKNLGGVAGVSRVVNALATCAAEPFLCLVLDSHLNVGASELLAAADIPLRVIQGDSMPCKNFKAEMLVPVKRGQDTVESVAAYVAHLIATHVRDGRSVWVPCSLKKVARILGSALASQLGDGVEIHILTADEVGHRDHVVSVFRGKARDKPGVPLVIISTATIAVGLDAGKGVFQAVVYAASEKGPPPSTVIQQISRVRATSRTHRVTVQVVVMDIELALGPCAAWQADPEELHFRTMTEADQAFVTSRTVTNCKSLRCREMMGEAVGPGPYFLKAPAGDKVTRLSKMPQALYAHTDAARDQTEYARLVCAAINISEGAAFHEVVAGANRLSNVYTGEVHVDHVLTAPGIEERNRRMCYLTRMEQLMTYEYGAVSRGPPLDLTQELAEGGPISQMVQDYTGASTSLAFEDAALLARHLRLEWLDGATKPLYSSADKCMKHLVGVLRDRQHLDAEEPCAQPAAEPGEEPGESDEEEPDGLFDDEDDPDFWTDVKRLKVFENFDLTIGRPATCVLVDKVLGYVKFVEDTGVDYATFVQTTAKKDVVPPEYKVGGASPVMVLAELYTNKNRLAPLFRAYCALRDDKEDYTEKVLAKLKKQQVGVLGKKVPEWVQLCKAQEITTALNINNMFATAEADRTFAITNPPPVALVKAVNKDRPASKAVKSGGQGVSTAVTAALRKVQIKVVDVKKGGTDKGGGPRLNIKIVELPPLVREFVCGPPTSLWEQLRLTRDEFWGRAYDGKRSAQ